MSRRFSVDSSLMPSRPSTDMIKLWKVGFFVDRHPITYVLFTSSRSGDFPLVSSERTIHHPCLCHTCQEYSLSPLSRGRGLDGCPSAFIPMPLLVDCFMGLSWPVGTYRFAKINQCVLGVCHSLVLACGFYWPGLLTFHTYYFFKMWLLLPYCSQGHGRWRTRPHNYPSVGAD